MSIRIAIPEPTSDAEYNSRSLQAYVVALQSCGAVPVVIPLHENQERVAGVIASTQGVVLPGSRFDVDPEMYGETRIPEFGLCDPERTSVDELLLQDAFNLRKPVLAICHGLQTLNVWLSGSLIQDIIAVTSSCVNHSPGCDIVDAHPVLVEAGSRLGRLADASTEGVVHVNSSHHQAIRRLGDRLRVAAISPEDGIVEAVELASEDHFVLGVQWHPERTFAQKEISRAIFRSFVHAAGTWTPTSVTAEDPGR